MSLIHSIVGFSITMRNSLIIGFPEASYKNRVLLLVSNNLEIKFLFLGLWILTLSCCRSVKTHGFSKLFEEFMQQYDKLYCTAQT